MSDQTTIRMTFDAYQALPESNLPHEFIDGMLVRSPSPRNEHQAILYRLLGTLHTMLDHRGALRAIPSALYLDDGNVVQPDVSWVSPDSSRCRLLEDDYWHGTPDLVIEILEDTTALMDRGRKFDLYQTAGVREYWLVDPEALFVEVYTHTADGFNRVGLYTDTRTFHSPLFDTDIDMKKVFQR